MDKLDDIKQRFYEFDIGEVKENAKDVVNNFVYEIKNVLGQVESELSNQWLKLRDQTA
jgi:actin-like ATPase involved in cell morphogenesis